MRCSMARASSCPNLVPGNGHWFSIAGARTDEFDDRNGNRVFDAGDVWVNDYDHDD